MHSLCAGYRLEHLAYWQPSAGLSKMTGSGCVHRTFDLPDSCGSAIDQLLWSDLLVR